MPLNVEKDDQDLLGQELVPLSTWEATADALRKRAEARTSKVTPPRVIKTRVGRGGMSFDYVKKGYVKKELDREFPGWSFVVPREGIIINLKALGVVVQGSLRVMEEGVLRIIDDMGGAEIKVYTGSSGERRPLSLGNDVKAARTDALKRCASNLGIAADVYDPEDDEEPSEEQLNTIHGLLKSNAFKIGDRERIKVNLDEMSATGTRSLIAKLENHISRYERIEEEKREKEEQETRDASRDIKDITKMTNYEAEGGDQGEAGKSDSES